MYTDIFIAGNNAHQYNSTRITNKDRHHIAQSLEDMLDLAFLNNGGATHIRRWQTGSCLSVYLPQKQLQMADSPNSQN